MPLDVNSSPILSVVPKDLQFTKTKEGLQIRHKASGVQVVCPEKDKKIAFLKLAQTEAFRTWIKQTTRLIIGKEKTVIFGHGWVDRWIRPEELRVDVWWRGLE